MDESKFLTVKEVAELLRVSVATVYRLRDANKLPQPVKIGRSVRYKVVEIMRVVDEGTE